MRTHYGARSSTVPKVRAALLIGALAAAATSEAAIYIHFDGIDGPVTVKGFEKTVAADSLSWSVAASRPDGKTGGGGSLITPVFSDLEWTQTVDQSVPPLFAKLVTGSALASTDVFFTTTVKDSVQTYFKMHFANVTLTELVLTGSSDDVPSVDGSFAYGLIELEYTTFGPDGSKKGTKSAQWDLVKNKGGLASLAAVYAEGMSGPTVVPLPGAAWLLGTALVALLAPRVRTAARIHRH